MYLQKNFSTLGLWFLITILPACSSLGPSFTPVDHAPPESAVVYVYRPRRVSAGLGEPQIVLDGKRIGGVSSGGYFPVVVSPGNHHIEASGPDYDLGQANFNVQSKKEYFLRVDLAMNQKSISAARSLDAVAPTFTQFGGSPADDSLYASDREIKETTKHLDQSAQMKLENPGFFFVEGGFAKTEIPQTKLSVTK